MWFYFFINITILFHQIPNEIVTPSRTREPSDTAKQRARAKGRSDLSAASPWDLSGLGGDLSTKSGIKCTPPGFKSSIFEYFELEN